MCVTYHPYCQPSDSFMATLISHWSAQGLHSQPVVCPS